MNGKNSPNKGEQAENVITKIAVKVIEEIIADFDGFDGCPELASLKNTLNRELHTAFAGRSDYDLDSLRKEAREIYNRTVSCWLDKFSSDNKKHFAELLAEMRQTRQIVPVVYYKNRKGDRREKPLTAAENLARFRQYSKTNGQKTVVSTVVYQRKYEIKGEEFDCEMDMKSKETRNFLALNYFDEIYTKFEEDFLSKLGLKKALQTNFKDIVFEDLVEWNFLQNPKALSHSIACALVRSCSGNAELAEKIYLLQQIYAENTGRKSNSILYSIKTFRIPELVEEILKSIED